MPHPTRNIRRALQSLPLQPALGINARPFRHCCRRRLRRRLRHIHIRDLTRRLDMVEQLGVDRVAAPVVVATRLQDPHVERLAATLALVAVLIENAAGRGARHAVCERAQRPAAAVREPHVLGHAELAQECRRLGVQARRRHQRVVSVGEKWRFLQLRLWEEVAAVA